MIRTYAVLIGMLLGTISFAQNWERVGLLTDDEIRSTCVAPNGDVFVATRTLHRSTDGGLTWKHLAHDVVLQSQVDGPQLYSKLDGTLFILTPAALLRSTDNGESWETIRNGSHNLNAFTVTPQGDLIQALDSIYLSSDNGNSWKSIRPSTGRVFADHDGVIYVSAAGNYRSTDRGLTWTKIINGLPTGSLVDEIKSIEQGRVYAVRGSTLYQSTDKGRVWSVLYTAPSTITGFVPFTKDTIVVGTMTGGVQTTTDAGVTWTTDLQYGTPSEAATGIFRRNGDVCVHLSRTIFRSSVGSGLWKEVALPSGIVSYVRVSSKGTIFAATKRIEPPEQHNWWSYNGSQWQHRISFEHMVYEGTLQAVELDSNDVLRGVMNRNFVSSTDSGSTWKMGIRFEGYAYRMGICRQFIYVSSNTQGIYRSSDQGETWDLMTTGLNERGLNAIAAGEAGIVYSGGNLQYFRSDDSGWTWREQVFPFISGSDTITAIECYGSTVIMAVDVTGVYFSSDFGLTWSNHSSGLPAVTINELVGTPAGAVFVATAAGLFEFDPSTKLWKDVGEIKGQITSLALGPDGRVYVGTGGDGVYRSTKTYGTWLSNVKRDVYSPDDISIYPNPAATEVQVRFKAEAPDRYRIIICDLLGATKLVVQNASTLDVSTLRNGQYFLRIISRDGIRTLPLSIAR